MFTKTDRASLANMDKQIYRLIGKAITLAACVTSPILLQVLPSSYTYGFASHSMAYRVRQGRSFVTPPTGLSYTGSFLYQLDKQCEERYRPSPVLEKALDVLFILHADHELNASSTTVLQTGSSLVDPYSAVALVIGELLGCKSVYPTDFFLCTPALDVPPYMVPCMVRHSLAPLSFSMLCYEIIVDAGYVRWC